jgi:putative ATP-binding cassette transporter
LGFLPFLARARVSIGRVNELSERFANPERGLGELDGHATATPQFGQVIELRDVRYAYQADAGEQAFVLGPLSMCIHRGEILFISGDNGSGKTTFLKILTGLYVPQAGEMLLDGVRVDAGNRDAYRQLFSPVLSDFHLFEELAEDAIVGPDKREEVARAGLERLALASKVAVKDGRFSTTDLSTGQRKRLALVHAWVEARPVMVFDEWAADQDPTFRHEFYTQLLPELRAQGHTLVVISHDDRYFGVADRVVDFRDGRLLGAAQNGESALLTAAGHA